jgi:hypothetical protein
MNIKIEKNIPITKSKGKIGEVVNIIRTMEIGDSFLVPIDRRGNMTQFFQNADYKCATRKISDTEVRVWRTA